MTDYPSVIRPDQPKRFYTAKTIFRPAKVRYDCPDCGLKRHDPDAVHCKHCVRTINIETEGE